MTTPPMPWRLQYAPLLFLVLLFASAGLTLLALTLAPTWGNVPTFTVVCAFAWGLQGILFQGLLGGIMWGLGGLVFGYVFFSYLFGG